VSSANAASDFSADDDDDDDDGIAVSLVSGDGRSFELLRKASKDSGLIREALNLNEVGELEYNADCNQQKKVDCIRGNDASLKHKQSEHIRIFP
jgi:hypothetical protein